MSNREALRELQTRLAQRLHGSGEDTQAASWLAFDCVDQGVIVPLNTAGEIFSLGPLTTLPHTKPWFLGVANLRGQLHGVVDLAAFLGLRAPWSDDDLRDSQRLPARLLAFNPALGSHCAVLMDRLDGLRSATQLQRLAPAATPRPAFASAEWRDTEGRIWQEIDLAQLARHEQFLSITA